MTLMALPGIPLVQPGDDLPRLILESIERAGLVLQTGDALAVTSKIISKAERRFVRLSDVTPGAKALQLAAETNKDPRIVELVLSESVAVVRQASNVLIVRHRLGFVSASAGIDQSNVEGGDDGVLLLPLDPDASAEAIRQRLREATGAEVGIVVSDSHGRPFRIGNAAVAIGVAGLPALVDMRGQTDLFGRVLKITVQAYADEIASAANLLSGEADEGRPVVLVRGLRWPAVEGHASDMIRPLETDLFR